MKLGFYHVNEEFMNFLSKFDHHVPWSTDKKKNRPYVGIVLNVKGIDYFASLTSPKEKHKKMKNGKDFLKIANGKFGAINFNNMIPILPEFVSQINLPKSIQSAKTEREQNYLRLLEYQLNWCNRNTKTILEIAKNLRSIYPNLSLNSGLFKRCCDFLLLEYVVNHLLIDNDIEWDEEKIDLIKNSFKNHEALEIVTKMQNIEGPTL